VRGRLLDRSRQTGEDFRFLLHRYAAERFLHRLGESAYRDRYILKGAMLFPLLGGSIYRATGDLDFTGYGGSEPTDADRHRLWQRDRASGDRGPLPDSARHAGPTDPRIPLESVVAEKLHAMVVLGERNSRYKDFYDLYVLARQFAFNGERLTAAVAATFERRQTAIGAALPVALAPRFYADVARAARWRAYLARNSLPGAPADWTAVGELLRAFLEAPLRAIADGRTFFDAWPPAGPWTAP
jgi:hypothetical protein